MPIPSENELGAPPCASLCDAMQVSRRTFLSAATLAAVAAVLESCSGGGGGDGVTGPSSGGGALTVTLSNFPQLATVGGIAKVDGGVGLPTALVRTGASTFVSLSMVCTHAGTTIGINGSGFLCPNHGAVFSSTGANIGGQPTSSLQSFSNTFNATAGTVLISRPT